MWDTHPQQARRGYSQVSADATLFPYVDAVMLKLCREEHTLSYAARRGYTGVSVALRMCSKFCFPRKTPLN